MSNLIEMFLGKIVNIGFSNVVYQMEDSHAWYFDGDDSDVPSEIKIEKEDYFASYRHNGNESWQGMDNLK